MRPYIVKPETQNWRLPPMGLAQPGKTCGLTGSWSGSGLPSRSESGFWMGPEWNWPIFAVQTRTTGRLPRPVVDTRYHSIPPDTVVVLATVPTRKYGSGLGLGPEPNRCNGFYHTKTRTFAIGPVLPPKTRHFNITTLAPIKYLSSDHIMTWSVRRLCSFRRSFTSRFHICDLTNIGGGAIENPRFSCPIWRYFTATSRILVGSHIRNQEVKARPELHNLHTDHVMIWSELKYLIGGKGVPKW